MKSARVRAASELTQESATLRTVQAVAQLLAGEQPPGIEALHQVLGALEHEAASHQRSVVVFIDEVQDLGDPDRWTVEDGLAVQQELERAMRQPGRLVTYAYAGSEETAMEHLFAAGKPLYREGERYVLPPIAPEAWLEGLTGRFAHDGRAITPDGIARILEASGGHPLRTMQVCRAALRTVRALNDDQLPLARVVDLLR
jgi:type II secretory pathway predicted ATPase ExeA